MEEDTGVDYVQPWEFGATISGLQGVGAVMKSNHAKYQEGDLVYGTWFWPWSSYFVQNLDALDQFTTKVSAHF